eukprot:4712309-Pyramimonas_sp.AAC.1
MRRSRTAREKGRREHRRQERRRRGGEEEDDDDEEEEEEEVETTLLYSKRVPNSTGGLGTSSSNRIRPLVKRRSS